MSTLRRTTLLFAGVCWIAQAGSAAAEGRVPSFAPETPRVAEVKVVPGPVAVDVEVSTTAAPSIRTSRLRKPDRLIFDFPNFQTVSRHIHIEGTVALSVRTAMYQFDPPVARLVIDLAQNGSYQIHSSGGKTLIRVESQKPHDDGENKIAVRKNLPRTQGEMLRFTITEGPARVVRPRTRVDVDANGLLTVQAEGWGFGNVLDEVAARLGAEIEFADDRARTTLLSTAKAKVTLNLGPAPAVDVLKSFFQGSPLDYIIIESPDGQLQKIIVAANQNVTMPVAANEVAIAERDASESPTASLPARIVSPVPGASIAGEITIVAEPQNGAPVAGVQFSVDGASLGNEITQEPYEIVWDTRSATLGTHVITAITRDRKGNSAASAGVSITVRAAD